MRLDNNLDSMNTNNKPKVEDITDDFNTMITYSGKIGGEMVRRMIQQQELKMMNEYNGNEQHQ